MYPISIIGSGLAGYTLAKEIRKLDKTIALQIFTADDGSFYSKPTLSNALSKQLDAKQLVMHTAEHMATQLNANIITHTRVTQINCAERTLIANNKTYPYASLVLASGAEAIRIPVAGDAAADIISVNSLQDYAQFRDQLQHKKHVTILGAGLIGCEFANDLANAGFSVSLIDLTDKPLGRLLPEMTARNLQQKLQALNISWHLGRSLSSMQHLSQQSTAYALTLDNQHTIQTDLVLSAIGLKPVLQLAQAANIKTARGIVTNEYLQTSEHTIYALGDCAEFCGSVLPFILPIMIGARALAKTLLGDSTPVVYPPMPVVVKTPAQAVVVCPPPMNAAGSWQEQDLGDGIKALFYAGNKLLGFALTGSAVAEKQKLVKHMQDSAA